MWSELHYRFSPVCTTIDVYWALTAKNEFSELSLSLLPAFGNQRRAPFRGTFPLPPAFFEG